MASISRAVEAKYPS